MFYVANSGDKMSRIANEFYGNELGRLILPKVIESNAHTLPFYVGMVGDDVLLPPYHIIYLPEFDVTHQFFPWKSMAGHLNGAPIEVRKNIGMLCESGIDLRVAIAAKEAGIIHKKPDQKSWQNREKRTEKINDYIDDADTIHGCIETFKRRSEIFNLEEAKNNMDKALNFYKNNNTFLSKQYLQESYKSLQKKFQIEFYTKLPLEVKSVKRSAVTMVHKRIFLLANISEVKKLISIGKYLKFAISGLGRHIPVVDGVLESIQVYESYKSGDGWGKMAAEDIAETLITSALTVGATAILALTPLGWGAFLLGVAVGYVGEKIGKGSVDYLWGNESEMSNIFLHHEYANRFFQ